VSVVMLRVAHAGLAGHADVREWIEAALEELALRKGFFLGQGCTVLTWRNLA
jgi:hypothetical protein